MTFTQISQNIKASKKALTCWAIDEEPLEVSRGVWHRNAGSRSSRLCLCFIAQQHDWLDIYRLGCYAAFWGQVRAITAIISHLLSHTFLFRSLVCLLLSATAVKLEDCVYTSSLSLSYVSLIQNMLENNPALSIKRTEHF